MPQLPPDSHPATASHCSSVAADAWPASAMPPPPITAPVNAILATLMLEVVGLRCRALIRRRRPLLMRPRGQLSGSGGRGRPATAESTDTAMTSPQGAANGSGSDFGGPLGPPSPSTGLCVPAYRMELGAIGEKARRSGRLGKLAQTLAGDRGGVIFWRVRRFAFRRNRGKHQEAPSSVQVVGYAIGPLPCCDHSVM